MKQKDDMRGVESKEKVLVEYQGKRFCLSRNLLTKYEVAKTQECACGTKKPAGRWYELGESDCY
ncbi:MAG: hypothetical protein Kow0090_16170 [Myxococcota bacterium]